jgi:alpha-glucoside transport system substrate-binding protein
VERGGFISANKNVPLESYPDEVSRKSAEILANAETFRFDAGDLMPAALSAAFFDAVVAYVDDPGSLDSILADLEATSQDARSE